MDMEQPRPSAIFPHTWDEKERPEGAGFMPVGSRLGFKWFWGKRALQGALKMELKSLPSPGHSSRQQDQE